MVKNLSQIIFIKNITFCNKIYEFKIKTMSVRNQYNKKFNNTKYSNLSTQLTALPSTA